MKNTSAIGKERNVLFNNNILFTVIWHQRYCRGAVCERGNPLLPLGLHFLINSKGSFISIISQTGQYIPQLLLHQSWSTDCNEKWLNESTIRDRFDNPSHHERTLLPLSYILFPSTLKQYWLEQEIGQWVNLMTHHTMRVALPWSYISLSECIIK